MYAVSHVIRYSVLVFGASVFMAGATTLCSAERGLPMICANPDFVSVAPDGSMNICPGATARRYEEIGGQVLSKDLCINVLRPPGCIGWWFQHLGLLACLAIGILGHMA